jgi:hypothetical protein
VLVTAVTRFVPTTITKKLAKANMKAKLGIKRRRLKVLKKTVRLR